MAIVVCILCPGILFAQNPPNPQFFVDFFAFGNPLLRSIFPLLFSVAVAGFFWGLALMIFNAGNEQAVENGKKIMIWGVVGLFVLTSLWGIVAFFGALFGIGTGGVAPVPGVVI